MAITINQEIEELNFLINALANRIQKLSNNVETIPDIPPYSKVSGSSKQIQVSDIGTGSFGNIAWNDSELNSPPLLAEAKPPEPLKGYNKHFHTRYAGGALDINSLEIVEHDIDWDIDETHSKHSQQFWVDNPKIKKSQNSANENVDKIGTMALIFDADSVKWGASAFEIDIKKCYFVSKDENGNIELDENGNEKKALLYNIDDTKTNIIWDSTAKVFRLYAVYSSTLPTP